MSRQQRVIIIVQSACLKEKTCINTFILFKLYWLQCENVDKQCDLDLLFGKDSDLIVTINALTTDHLIIYHRILNILLTFYSALLIFGKNQFWFPMFNLNISFWGSTKQFFMLFFLFQKICINSAILIGALLDKGDNFSADLKQMSSSFLVN